MIRNFKITSNIDDLQVYIDRHGSVDNLNIQYRKVYDGSADDWESYDLDNRPYFQLMSGESVEFINDTAEFSLDQNNYLSFDIYGSDGDRSTADFTVSGNLGSLLYGEYEYSASDQYEAPQHCFYRLFANSGVTNARNLLLCFGSVGYGAFRQMFDGCSNLKQGPAIGDYQNIGYYAFAEFFQNCSSLEYVDWMLTHNEYAANYYYFYNFLYGAGQYGSKIITFDSTQNLSQLDIPWNWQEKLIDYFTITPDQESFWPAEAYVNEWNELEFYTPAHKGWCKYDGTIELYEVPFIKMRTDANALAFTGFDIQQDFNISGKLYTCWNWKMSEDEVSQTQMNFNSMFSQCQYIIDASDLEFPESPYTNYTYMFQGSSLRHPPRTLPSEIFAYNAFSSMFQGCTSLNEAPVLPATTLNGYCYQNMFEDCRSLTQAPELPATNLAEYCYYEMFKGCTSLNEAPELPATTLAERCYQSMFQGCTSLTKAPELPAAKMESACYNSMFKQCGSLKKAPVLASTQLANDCYSIMFEDCDLDEAPELPATVLAGYCYYHMFTRNRNLKKAPLIAGVQIGSLSYYNMFQNCSSLNEMIYTSTSIPSQTGQWLSGVSSKGTFYYTDKNLNVAAIPRSAAGIPAGWTIQYLAPKPSLVFSINGRAVSSLTINGKAVAKLG